MRVSPTLQSRLTEAAHSLCDKWFAASPAVHELVSHRLRNGYYAHDPDALLADLMTDAALFGYCLKELTALVRRGEVEKPEPFDVGGYFRAAGLARLTEILRRPFPEVSMHALSSGSDAQAVMLQQMLLQTRTAELLSGPAQFPKAAGFGAAFLRQLGVTLIAWNYPHVFRQAVTDVKNGTRLDAALLKYLGYSPRILALTIAREWGLSAEYLYVLGDTRPVEDQYRGQVQQIRGACDRLAKACEVGETLARVQYPELFPEAKRNWFDAKVYIGKALGPRGLEILEGSIRRSVETYSSGIAEKLRDVFKVQELSEIEGTMPKPVVPPASPDESWPKELVGPLSRFYDLARQGRSKKKQLSHFGEDLALQVGFSGGAIFLYDLDSSILLPRYQFGSALSHFINPVSVSPLLPSFNPLVEAFRSGRCVYEHTPWFKDGVNYVAQSFAKERLGVLYLEVGHALRGEDTNKLLKIFSALLKALERILETPAKE